MIKPRGRPIKPRNIRSRHPQIQQFSPRGRPGRPHEIELKLEEFEALKLADYIGLSQKKAANMMGVSQQTFSRVVRQARKIIANALIMGKIIKIQGGHYRIAHHIDHPEAAHPDVGDSQKNPADSGSFSSKKGIEQTSGQIKPCH